MNHSDWEASASRPPVIVTDSNASEPVKFAAQELRTYLTSVLGTELPASAASGAPTIKLGVRKSPELGDEGYRISASHGVLTITGGGDAGVVYGAYYFLRKFAGCIFSAPGPDGELVPLRRQITFAGPAIEMKPPLWYRGMQIGRPEVGEDLTSLVSWLGWMAKNGLNYVLYYPRTGPESERFDKDIAPEVLKRGLKLDRNHHGFSAWLPPDKYFDKHPDYCALIDGKRDKKANQLSICTSNPEAVAAYIDNLKAYLRSHPAVKIVGVIPEDGYGMCECDKCKAMDAELEHEAAPEISPEDLKYLPMNRAKTRRYALLVNECARAIHKEFPNVLVGSAAYVDLVWPDPKVRLEPNVVTWVAIYWRDGARVLSAGSPSAKNRAYFDCLRMWRKLHPGKVILYEYYMGMSAQKSLPYPQDRVIVRDWPELESIGVLGATIQCMPSVTNTYTLNLAAFARLGWGEKVDPAALQTEYLQGMYGAAAEAVRPIYDAFHEAWRRAEEGPDDSPDLGSKQGTAVSPNGRSIVLIMDILGEDNLDRIINSARAAASNERERRQVNTLSLMADYWKQAARFYRLKDKLGADASEDAANQLRSQLKQVTDSVGRLPYGCVYSGTTDHWSRERTSK